MSSNVGNRSSYDTRLSGGAGGEEDRSFAEDARQLGERAHARRALYVGVDDEPGVCQELYRETRALGLGGADMVAVVRAIEQRTATSV